MCARYYRGQIRSNVIDLIVSGNLLLTFTYFPIPVKISHLYDLIMLYQKPQFLNQNEKPWLATKCSDRLSLKVCPDHSLGSEIAYIVCIENFKVRFFKAQLNQLCKFKATAS
jgi:hypothetical protein